MVLAVIGAEEKLRGFIPLLDKVRRKLKLRARSFHRESG
jgi:hypothetical protein